jgi:hypothetical protein
MWQWLTEVVSSPRSMVSDPNERNNHMFFYEKMETLVKAAWIMNRGTNQVTNRPRQVPEKEDHERKDTTVNAAQSTRFAKPARLIEKVNT